MSRVSISSVRLSLLLGAALLGLASPSLAQCINIDIGTYNPQPSGSYGAAAAQPGVWNHMTSGSAMSLVDLSGGSSGVSVSSTGFGWGFGTNNVNTTGDDELLLDAGHDGANTFSFTGLTNGDYDVYTYAWAPDNPVMYLTTVDVPGSIDPQQTVGGADWTGVHIQGVTYAKHHITISNNQLQIVCNIGASFATINGIQIKGTVCCSSPFTYCTAKVNSLGCLPAIHSFGQASATQGYGFAVIGVNVRNQKSGLLFYGVSGQAGTPFQNGTLCVASPVKRTPPVTSGGSALPANNCSGIYSMDMNSFAVGALGGTPLAGLTIPGTTVNCQWWGRDSGFAAPNNTTLTDGLQYTVCQ
jgi:hypothetical protein